jgi:hypothetical protein
MAQRPQRTDIGEIHYQRIIVALCETGEVMKVLDENNKTEKA